MRRFLLLLLVTIVVAGYLGTLIARDPGYVLVTWGGYSVQTSLWVLVGLIAVLLLLENVTWRIWKTLTGSSAALRSWRAGRRSARAERLHEKGLALLAEGESVRARKFLEGAAKEIDASGVHYLAAARAADEAGDAEGRETYLRLAEETEPGLARARSVVAAELALGRGEPGVALAVLKNVKTNVRVARLRQQALQMQNDWQQLLASVGVLRELDPDRAAETEADAARRGLRELAGDDQKMNALFRSLSAGARSNPDVVVVLVDGLTNKSEVEPVLRSVISKNFNRDLVMRYGDLDGSTLKTRRKAAQGWLKQHADDPALHYCLGCIHEMSGEAGLARDAFAKAVELGGSAAAHQRLGLLLAQDGQFEKSAEQFRLSMLG
ncbi:MAG: hypothetical protein O3B72_02555 [Proteobacteria bacterium]|nr:hypothetical protein [Pseudomonadota bacterium]